ncbi:putative glycogen, partial [Operophtera brumata]
PYKEQCARTEVEEAEFPPNSPLTAAELWDTTSIGIPHLDAEANDAVILGFMVAQFIAEPDRYKQEIWDTTSIGIPHLDVEANDAVILGFMVVQFIAEVTHLLQGLLRQLAQPD